MRNHNSPDQPPQGPYVGIVPYGFRPRHGLAKTPLSQLHWPLGAPPNVEAGTVADLGEEDHICSFPAYWLYLSRNKGMKAQISIVIVEPTPIHGHHMWLARLFHRRFYRILSCNPGLLAAVPNGNLFIYGDSWVKDWNSLDLTKTAMVSLIASKKRQQKGHKLRHQVVREIRKRGIECDVMGRGYRPIEDKAEGLAPYRFSVVIENTREPGYITEKLIDALLCKTVPIYWGAPDVGKYFDTNGMIICNSFDEIMMALSGLDEAAYEERSQAIEKNREIAARYADNLKSVATIVRG